MALYVTMFVFNLTHVEFSVFVLRVLNFHVSDWSVNGLFCCVSGRVCKHGYIFLNPVSGLKNSKPGFGFELICIN